VKLRFANEYRVLTWVADPQREADQLAQPQAGGVQESDRQTQVFAAEHKCFRVFGAPAGGRWSSAIELTAEEEGHTSAAGNDSP
jgi:hypothetical protein